MRTSPKRRSGKFVLERSVHLAYVSPASALVTWFPCALALRRRDKGKPAARRGRKAHGPLFFRREVAGLPNGGGVTIHIESPKERAPPPT